MKNLKPIVVCVDVDGTLLSGQSQKQFLKFLYRARIISLPFYTQILGWFVLYKLGIAGNPKKVMQYAYAVIRGKTQAEVDVLIDKFFSEDLERAILKPVYDQIMNLKEAGAHIVLLSNSTDIIIGKLAAHIGIKDYFATKLSIQDGVYDGDIIPPIMYGKAKTQALDSFLEDRNLSDAKIITYTDHISDLPLLERADEQHVVNPHGKLKRIAKEKGWDIIEVG